MKPFYLILILTFVFSNYSLAQQPTDCIDSVIVCGNSSVNLDVNGIGTQELSGSNTCFSQENNSIWLQVTVINTGTLGFTLTPNSASITEDYDFFIFGPNVLCSNIGQAIRCSTTNPQNAGQGNNLTGMNGSETDVSEGPGADGNSFVRWLDVNAGDSYFIVIDRPIGNSPFSLEWTGTAEFAEPPVNNSGSGTALNIENCDVINPYNDNATEFNLDSNSLSIIGAQPNVIVTYHETESDANINISPLTSPYTNISNPQTIFVRITNSITGCFELDTFQLDVNSGPNYTEPTNLEDCDNTDDGDSTNGQIQFDLSTKDSEILDGQNPADFTITYHENQIEAENDTNPLPNIYYNTSPNFQQIFVRIEDLIDPDCRSITTLILVVNQLPQAFDSSLFQCDEDGLPDGFTLFNLTEASDDLTGGSSNLSTKFFLSLTDAENSSNEIDGSAFNNFLNPQTIYVQVIDDTSGCFDISELTLEVSATNANDAGLAICDDDETEDGFNTFNLSDTEIAVLNGLPNNLDVQFFESYEDALLEVNPLNTDYTNTIAYSQIIYVRVENENACYGINEIQLTVFELPNIETEFQTIYCLNTFPETVTLTNGIINDLPSNYLFNWSTGENTSEIEINEPGTYNVNVSNVNSCSKTRIITVLPSNIATIDNIEVSDASQNNTITILISGEGDYELALDNINGPYFDDNLFENVSAGIHTVFVRDKNDCGIVEELVSVIGFPRFFTPNNDGYNDTWQVKGVNPQFQPNTLIYIYDRYGKLISQIDPAGLGWNGFLNGRPLPNDDYWFAITLEDGRIFKDHFTLKR